MFSKEGSIVYGSILYLDIYLDRQCILLYVEREGVERKRRRSCLNKRKFTSFDRKTQTDGETKEFIHKALLRKEKTEKYTNFAKNQKCLRNIKIGQRFENISLVADCLGVRRPIGALVGL
jgi:hypothetical protein